MSWPGSWSGACKSYLYTVHCANNSQAASEANHIVTSTFDSQLAGTSKVVGCSHPGTLETWLA